MKLIYLGTPEFALQPLKSILDSRHEVVMVITQPDKANARGKVVNLSAVKAFALEKGLPVMQPKNIRQAADELKKLNADIMVTCAYGQILSQEILDVTPHGVINIHASILPKYRGSSPVQHALINGEKVIGVTIMQTELSLDTGDIILQSEVRLTGEENAQDALSLLSNSAAPLIVEALDRLSDGTATFRPQNESEATYFPMLKKEDGRLDFERSAEDVKNFIRGVSPWPSAYCVTKYGKLKVIRAEIGSYENIKAVVPIEEYEKASAGTVLIASAKKGFYVKCIDSCLKLLEVQGENAVAMTTSAYLLGKPIERNTQLC